MQSVGLNNKELALFVRSVLLPVPLSSWCQWTMVSRCLTLSLLLLRWRPRQTTSRQCRPTLCSLPRPDNCRVELARQEPTFSADMVTRQLAYTLFRNRTKKRIIHRYLFMFVTAKYLSKQLRTGERERGLVVGFCDQPHYSFWPYYRTARFQSPSSHMVSDEPFPGRSRPISC